LSSEENIACIVMMPAVMREAWREPDKVEDAEAFLRTCTAYSSELERFAYSEEKREQEFYERFRNFLSRYSPIFQKDYALIEFITDEQIEYALEQVKEARNAQLAEKLTGTVKAKQLPVRPSVSHKT